MPSGSRSAADRLTMAVNVSPREFIQRRTSSTQIDQTLRRHGVEPTLLCLEMNESALLAEIAEIGSGLRQLSALGVRLALDDFGTGYSALTHLRHFTVDMLKIDRSFVERLGSDDRDRDIVGAVAAMAHALGMTIVGEGIESSGPAQRPAAAGLRRGAGLPAGPAAVGCRT